MTDAPAPPYVGPAHFMGGYGNKPIKRVVIHATVSPCEPGGAQNVAAYFRSRKATGSAHYVVDPGAAVQVVYDSYVAYHAPPNEHSLGVELCDPQKGRADRWHDAPHEAMLKRAAVLVAGLCKAYDIPVKKRSAVGLKLGRKGICGHADVSKAFRQSTHTDPGDAFPWKHFMRLVQDAYDGREYVTVKDSESIHDIAERAGITVARLWRLNMPAPRVGQRLRTK